MQFGRLARAIGICLIVVFLITMVMGVNLLSSILVAFAPCTIGIVIGCLMYYIVTGGSSSIRRARFSSGAVSAALAAGLDWFVFTRTSGVALPQFAVMVNIGVAYTCIVAGALGLLFGANVLHVFKDDGSV
jgi:hypothetical protein